jgi:hypothetical protein
MIDSMNDPFAEKRGEIFRRKAQADPNADSITPGKSLALTADNRVVDGGDPEAEFVLVGEFGTLPADLAKELGVKASKVKAVKPADETPTAPTGVTITNAEPVAQTITMGSPTPEPAPV